MKPTSDKLDKCQNCQHPLDEHANFCPNCGQRTLSNYLSVRYFISEFLNNYFSFDSKFVNTIRPLLFKPAFLSLEFIQGRRIRYINPVQLFIFISFLYFFVDSIFLLKEDPDDVSYVKMTAKNASEKLDSLLIFQDSVVTADHDSTIIEGRDSAASGELYLTLPDSTDGDDGNLLKTFLERSQRFNELDKAEQTERVNKLISYFIFLLTPIFALLLGLFFRKGRRHFLENLIFSLHYHAFYFLLSIFFMLFDRLLPGDLDEIVTLLVAALYLFFALRRFYCYKLWATFGRLLGLSVIYLLIVMVCFIASIVISIML